MFNPNTLPSKQAMLAGKSQDKKTTVADTAPQKVAKVNASNFDFQNFDYSTERQRTQDAVDVARGRDAAGIFGDTAVSLAQGVNAVNTGIYGLTDAGTYGGLDDITGMADKFDNLDKALESLRSDVGKKQYAAYRAVEAADSLESEQTRQQDLVDGFSPFVAGAMKEGRDAYDTAKNLLSTPSILADETVKQVPQLAGAGVAGSLLKKGLVKKGKDLTDDQIKSLAAKEIAAGTAGGIIYTGASEGGSAGLDAKATILAADQEVLYDNSEEYRRLVDEEGYSPNHAQDTLSKNEQARTTLITGMVAAGVSLVTGGGKFSGNLGGTTKTKIKDIGSETIEEASQGLAGEVQQNRVTKENINPEKSLIEGTGAAIGKGAVLGATSSATVGPALATANVATAAAKAIPEATKAATDTLKQAPATVKKSVKSAKVVEAALKTGDTSKVTRPLDKLEVALDTKSTPKKDATKEERSTYRNNLLDIGDELSAERAALIEKHGDQLPKKAEKEFIELSAAITKVTDAVTSGDTNEDTVQETSESLDKDIHVVKNATERTPEAEEVIFRSSRAMDTQRSTVTEATAQAIVDSPITTDTEKKRAELFIATRRAESIEEVSDDIKYGNEFGDVGYTQYQTQLGSAIARNKEGAAKSTLTALRNFAEGHIARTKLISDTFDAYKENSESPETLALIESTRQATINKKTKNGFVVSAASNKPLTAMKAEDAALSAALAEAEFAYSAKFASQPETTKPVVDQKPAEEESAQDKKDAAKLALSKKRSDDAKKKRIVNTDKDTIAEAAIKLGGLSKSEQLDVTRDTKTNPQIVGIGYMFGPKGTSIDDLAIRLHEEGYIPISEMDNLGGVPYLQEALGLSVDGTDTFAPDSKAETDQLIQQEKEARESQYEQEEQIEADSLVSEEQVNTAITQTISPIRKSLTKVGQQVFDKGITELSTRLVKQASESGTNTAINERVEQIAEGMRGALKGEVTSDQLTNRYAKEGARIVEGIEGAAGRLAPENRNTLSYAFVADQPAQEPKDSFDLPTQVLTDKVSIGGNTINEFMKPKGDASTSLLRTSTNLVNDLRDVIQGKPGLTNERLLGLNEEQKAALPNLTRFLIGFRTAMKNQVFEQHEHNHFKASNAIEYLADANGNLDNGTIDAIGLAAYNWVATQSGRTTFNTNKTINSFLGFDSDHVLKSDSSELFNEIGTPATNTQENLGAEIINSIGITARSNTPGNFAPLLELSVGSAAIVALTKMNLADINFVTNSEMAKHTAEDSFNEAANTNFIRVRTTLEDRVSIASGNEYVGSIPAERPTSIIDNVKDSDNLLAALFDMERVKEGPSFNSQDTSPIVQGSNQTVTKVAKDALNTLNKVPYTFNNVFESFDSLSVATQAIVAGFETDLIKEHVNRRASIISANKGVERELQQLMDFRDIAEDVGLEKAFFMVYNQTSNTRHQMVDDGITTQGSKVHRAFVGPTANEVDVTDKNLDNFKLAILEAFGEKPDVKFLANGGFYDGLIADPIIQAGIEAVTVANLAPSELTEQQEQDIIAAVNKMGEASHSYAALVSLSNQAQAQGEAFKTSLPLEVDGVTNGVMHLLIQTVSMGGALQLRDALERGGFFYSDQNLGIIDWLSDPRNKDSYENITFNTDKYLSTNQDQDAVARAKTILGVLVIDGDTITTNGRKFAKAPLMTSSYGAALKTIIENLANHAVDSAEDSIAAAPNQDALNDFTDSLGISRVDFDLRTETQLTYEDVKSIRNDVTNTYGDALSNALEETYGPLFNTVSALNKAGQVMYAAYQLKMKESIAEAKLSNGGNVLSRDEMKAIEAENLKYAPTIPARYSKSLEENVLIGSRENVRNSGIDNKSQLLVKGGLTTTNAVTGETKNTQSLTSHTSTNQLADPGVSVGPIMTQSADAANILSVFNEQLLSVHDAIISNIDDVSRIGRDLNKDFLKGADYSLPGSVAESLDRVLGLLTDVEIASIPDAKKVQAELNTKVKTIHTNKAKVIAHVKKKGKVDQFGGNDTAYYPTEFVGDLNTETANKLLQQIKTTQTENTVESDTAFLKELVNSATTVAESLVDSTYEEALNKLSPKARRKFEDYKAYAEDARDRKNRAKVERAATETKVTEENIEKVSSKVVKDVVSKPIQEEFVFNSSVDGIDVDSFKAKITETVSPETAQSVFDLLGEKDNRGKKEETTEHSSYLGQLLSDVKEQILEPITVMLQDLGDESIGQLSGNNIHINASTPGVTSSSEMSTQEVYVHELVHSLLRPVFDSATWVKAEVYGLFDAAAEALTVEDFMPDVIPPGMTEAEERENAQARYDHIFNNNDTRVNSKGEVRNNSYHEFFTMAATNAKFRELLASKVTLPSTKLFANGITGVIGQIFRKAARIIIQQINGTRNLRADDAMTQLLNEVIGTNNRKQSLIMQGVDVLDATTSTSLRAIQDYILDPLNTGLQSDAVQNSKIKFIAKTGSVANIAINSKFGDQLKIYRRIASRLEISERNIFAAFATELLGRTDVNGRYHDHLRKIKHTVESLAFKASESLAQNLDASFHVALDQQDQEAMTIAGLMTDLSSIYEDYSLPDLSRLMTDSDYRIQEINKFEQLLDTEFSTHSTFYKTNADSLAHYMLRNTFLDDGNAMHNAQLIAELKGTPKDMTPEGDLVRAEELINKLTTLYSITYVPKTRRDQFAAIIDRETDIDSDYNGIAYSMNHHSAMKADVLKTNFDGQSRLMIKGYIPDILNPDITFKVAKLTMEEELKSMGYIKGDRVVKDNDDPNQEPLYFFINKDGMQNRFQSMAAAHNSNVSKGKDLISIRYQANQDFATTLGNNDFDSLLKTKTVKSGEQSNGATGYDVSNLSPVVDGNGNIVQYRYEMPEKLKSSLMQKDYTFSTLMGRMAASVEAKPAAKKGNSELVKMIHEDWTESGSEDPKQFVTVGLNSSDPKHRELYQLLPKEMRKEVLDTFGDNNFKVRRMLIPLILGQRKLSISDFKPVYDPIELHNLSVAKRFMNHFTKLAAKSQLRQAEGVAQELVGHAKDAIVIKSGVVTLGNIKSNNWLLWMKGMSGGQLARYQAQAMNDLIQYKADLGEYDRLKAEVLGKTREGIDKNVQTKMDRLQDKMNTNSIHELIEEGMLQSIVEDVDVEREGAHTYKDRVDSFVDPLTSKIPEPIKDATNLVLMGHNTKLYQFLRSTTQASDFVARAALHRYNLEKGMDKQDSFADIAETFVNYELPTHPGIQYANDIGVWMFSKFAVRIQKVILTTIKNSPARVLGLVGIDTMVSDLEYITEQSLLVDSPNIDDTLDTILGTDYAPLVSALGDALDDL